MYVSTAKFFQSRFHPLFLSTFYEKVAELYNLPALKLLFDSLESDVVWPNKNQIEVYYEDNLMKNDGKHRFHICYAYAPNGRDLISLFLSVEQSQVQSLIFHFPGRSGRMGFSRILGIFKALVIDLDLRDVHIDVEGFAETYIAPIRERTLSAFVWIEGLKRYLHAKENPAYVESVRKGKETI